MRVIYDLDEMTETARGWLAGGSVGLVIVNGNLHEGHLVLVRSSVQECELSVVCIFDNSLRFESAEVLARMPLNLATNLQLLDLEHVDVVFIPRPSDFYPSGFSTRVVPFGPIAEKLEGAIQPDDMRQVATSMTKLFQLVRPDKVYLGQKKAQQNALIRKLVEDLNIDLTVRVLPIVRESDGVAISNQLGLLSQVERQAVVHIYQALLTGKSMIEKGEYNTSIIKKEVASLIATEPLLKLDYVSICDPATFEEMRENWGTDLPEFLLTVSVSVGAARLVDNILWNNGGFWLN
ncbi:MAG: 4-phosphopantoate--beta-alanine ligase [Ktedonobacteraceae bacterium]